MGDTTARNKRLLDGFWGKNDQLVVGPNMLAAALFESTVRIEQLEAQHRSDDAAVRDIIKAAIQDPTISNLIYRMMEHGQPWNEALERAIDNFLKEQDG